MALKKIIVDNENKIININDNVHNFLFTYRTTPSTITNQSPANLMFKYKSRTPVTVLNKNKIEIKTKEIKETSNHNEEVIEFEVGENIYYKNHLKDLIKWIPCKIVNKISKYVYSIELKRRVRIAHINQLRKEFRKVKQWADYSEEILKENVELNLKEKGEDNEIDKAHEESNIEQEETDSNQNKETDSLIGIPSERPRRDKNIPSRFKDFILY